MCLTHMRGCFIAVALVTLALPGSVSAQVSTADLESALAQLQSAAADITPDFFGRGPNPARIAEANRLKAAVDWLNGPVAKARTAAVPPESLRSLQRAAAGVKREPARQPAGQ